LPTYQYSCTECGHFFEQFQSFSEDSLTVCPECEGRLRKVFNAVGVVFKGSGFYRTDSRNDARTGSGSGETAKPAAASSSSDGSSSAGTSGSGSSAGSDSGSGSGSGSGAGAKQTSSSPTSAGSAA
jgi:putative FmdB family regulatory protein